MDKEKIVSIGIKFSLMVFIMVFLCTLIVGILTFQNLNGLSTLIQSYGYIPISIVAALAIGILLFLISLAFVRKMIVLPLKELIQASNKLVAGDTDIHITEGRKDEIGQLMAAFESMVQNTIEQSKGAQKIADGDLSFDIVPRSEKDIMAKCMQEVSTTLKNVVEEFKLLRNAAVNGDLSKRGDAEKFKGSYQDIVAGMNDTLDAIATPTRFVANYVDTMGKGEILPEVNLSEFEGEFKTVANNLLVLRGSLDNMIDSTGELTKQAILGNLSYRADLSKLGGKHYDIVDGVNKALDAVIEPIEEASVVFREIKKGNLSARVTGEYQGDHAEIKETVNVTAQSLQRYVQEISDTLEEIANKNLDTGIQSLDNEYEGDFIKLKDSINHIVNQLNEILTEIRSAAEQVETGAEQVSGSSQNLSQGASEQAGSVEEIGATINEVSEQTNKNAENANKANDLSTKAKVDAQQGNQQMNEMLLAMDEIKESSKNISNIIKVIDEIAFQTNILALNAAVEAARAGEHGKGFAVVAEEVRNLAARSAEAAKETTELIDNSINKVEEGNRIANDTAEALNKIVEGVADAENIVSMIAEASKQQASSISEINRGIEQISDVTQSNTASAEESASASEQMAGQAQMLKEMIEAFKLKHGASLAALDVNKENRNKNMKAELELQLDDDSFGKY